MAGLTSTAARRLGVVRRRIAVCVGCITCGAPLFGTGGSEADGARVSPVAVVATTAIIADLVAQVAGEHASVTAIAGRGTDPHAFHPSALDAQRIDEASIVFTNGAGLEPPILRELTDGARVVVQLVDTVPLRTVHGGAGARGTRFDPHAWLDPTLVAVWVTTIGRTLATIDPSHLASYLRNAALLAGELNELDDWARGRLATIPPGQRLLVTDHDVLGYFAERYGLVVLGSLVPGLSSAAEPSARHTAELQDAIVTHGVTAIFVGPDAGANGAPTLARDLGVQVVTLQTGTLGRGHYQGFMRSIVEAVVDALGP